MVRIRLSPAASHPVPSPSNTIPASRVRIRFPPAASLRTLGPSAKRYGSARRQGRNRDGSASFGVNGKKGLWSGPSFPRIVRPISQEIENCYLPMRVISCERFASQLGGWKVQPRSGGVAGGEGSAVPCLSSYSGGNDRPRAAALSILWRPQRFWLGARSTFGEDRA